MKVNKKKYKYFFCNKTKKTFIEAFTLTEVIITTFISSIVLSFIFIFLSNIVNGIGETRIEVDAMSSFYDITNKINNYRNVYITGGILIETSTGSDVFLMKDSYGENGILIGVVKLFDNKLDTDNAIYEEKGLGFRKMSSSELLSVETDSNNAYDLSFQKDYIFADLKVKDLMIESYNSGHIIDFTLVVDLDFQTSLAGQLRNDLPKDSLKIFNIDF